MRIILNRLLEDSLTMKFQPESLYHLACHSDHITCRQPDGTTSQINLTDLKVVIVETNDTGPWGADVWWVLLGANAICKWPQGASGEKEIITVLQSLPGFDNEQVINAMSCTDSQLFVCWKAPD